MNYKHGQAISVINGVLRKREAPEYATWRRMLARCSGRGADYENYAGRGIIVCERWRGSDGLQNFLADMGMRPTPHHSLDRIDNNKGYSPDNCRWATRIEQNRNTRHNTLESHEPAQIRWLLSEGFSGAEIARHFEISKTHVGRIRKNLTRVDAPPDTSSAIEEHW